MNKSAWVIESSVGWYVRQWSDGVLSWTSNVLKALKFAEKEQADKLIATKFDGDVQPRLVAF